MKLSLLRNVLVIGVVLTLPTCDKNPAEGDDIDVAATEAAAYAELENQMFAMSNAAINNSSDLDQFNFGAANALYKSILNSDPTNATANFGAALTEVFGSYADSSVNGAIKRWENSGAAASEGSHLFRFKIPSGVGDMTVPNKALAENLAKIILTGMTDPPTIAEMQTILKEHFVPRIDYALACLQNVEQVPTFQMRISGKMQGDPGISDVYMDLTEVYVLDAMLRGVKAGVDQFLVYRFDLPSYTTKAAVEALQPTNNSFFVLASDGAARAAGIHANVVTMVGRIRSGIAFLKSETDNQSDDIIKLGAGGIASADLDSVDSYLSQALTWLTSTQTVTIRGADTDGNDYTIQINLQSFFQNPPQNPKLTWLPAYTVDSSDAGDIMWHWTQQDYASFTFPDPTFSGTFPGMSNTTLKRLLHIDEEFAWRLEVNVYDDSFTMTSSSITVTANGQTYYPKARYSWSWTGSRSERFLILDNDGQPAAVAVTFNGTPLSIVMREPLSVRLKDYEYVSIDVTPASQTATGTGYGPSPRSVSLDLKQYGYYSIERRTTGSFAVIDSVWSSWYSDYSVPAAGTYEYRALRTISPYYWYGNSGVRANNYTNTIVVTVP